jgi:hypothetical protein
MHVMQTLASSAQVEKGYYWRSLQSSIQFRLVFPYCVFSSCLQWNLLFETVSRIRKFLSYLE